jgi:hypothetical protein
METEKRFNVVEILSGPKAGRICVVPCPRSRPRAFYVRNGHEIRPLTLRTDRARYRVCNVSFEFADGVACGIILARRETVGQAPVFHAVHYDNDSSVQGLN